MSTNGKSPSISKIEVPTTGYFHVEGPTANGSGSANPEPAEPAPTLIAIHGFAQTAPGFAEDLRGFVPSDYLVAAPQGFHQMRWPRSGKVTFSWMTSYEKGDSIDRNNGFIASILDGLVESGRADPRRVFVLGFSQGSAVAYRFAHRYPDRVRGVISVCADLPPDVEAEAAELGHIPVLILNGREDTMYPPAKAEHAHAALSKAGLDVETHPFDGGHAIPMSLAENFDAWLRRHGNPGK